MDAAKEKNLSLAGFTALRLLLLLVVGLCWGQTCVWGFVAEPHSASGQIAAASASAVGEIAPAWTYDVSKCAVASEETASLLPARGFIDGTVERKFLMPGETVDQYGFGGGRFVSTSGTPVEACALRPGTENLPFNTYRVVKPIEVNAGDIQPWFNQPGLGTQYQLPVSVNVLLKRGFLVPVIP